MIDSDHVRRVLENNGISDINGCHGPIEVQAYLVQKHIIEPFFKENSDRIPRFDDFGHDLPLKQAWNRALDGKPEPWDCRMLGNLFVQACFTSFINFNAQKAVIKNLPGVLNKGMMDRAWTAFGGNSWITGEKILVSLKDWSLSLSGEKKGLTEAKAPPGLSRLELPEHKSNADRQLLILGNFEHDEIPERLSDEAWSAAMTALDATYLGLNRNLDSARGVTKMIAVGWMQNDFFLMPIRQDERISIQTCEDGFRILRGAVGDLPEIETPGGLLVGTISGWTKMLTRGAMDAHEVEAFLSAAQKAYPGQTFSISSEMHFMPMLDAETLFGFDLDDPDDFECLNCPEEAVPLLVVRSEVEIFPSIRMRKLEKAEPLPEP